MDSLYPVYPDQTPVYPSYAYTWSQAPSWVTPLTSPCTVSPQQSSQNNSHQAPIQMRSDDVNCIIVLVSVVQWLPITSKGKPKVHFLCSGPFRSLRSPFLPLSLLPPAPPNPGPQVSARSAFHCASTCGAFPLVRVFCCAVCSSPPFSSSCRETSQRAAWFLPKFSQVFLQMAS